MFPYLQQKVDDLYFQISSATTTSTRSITYQPNTITQDPTTLLLPHAAMDHIQSKSTKTPSQKLVRFSNQNNKTDTNITDNHTKRVMHRDMERQRRQEMATLCTSLRDLLPLQYIKGKRSASDHMHEAVNYIKDLENKIKELGVKKDELKKLTNMSDDDQSSSNNCVMVRPCLVGVEVVISSGLEEQVVLLSRILQVLLKEGLNVIACYSTKVNTRLIHTIQSEAGDRTGIDASVLQNKLTATIIPSTID